MARRWRLTLPIAALAAVAMLSFPASGSALSAVFIQLTPTGPSPAALSIAAGTYPVFVDTDSMPHTVVFANGVCTLHVTPSASGQCSQGLPLGPNTYTVDGKASGTVTVVQRSRAVTLGARAHAIRRGERLTLHGLLKLAQGSPPPAVGHSTTSIRVTLLTRPDRRHPFRAVASVRPATLSPDGYPWHRAIRPRETTIYLVESNRPTGWQPAQSRPFKVVVRR